MKTSQVIKKLQQLVDKNGDREFTIYHGFSKANSEVKENDIYFDEELKDIYISIYN